MPGRLTGALRDHLHRLRPNDRRGGLARTSAMAVMAAAVLISCAVFAGILATLWLVSAGDGGRGHRDVVMALPPATAALSEAASPASAGIDGGLVVSPLSSAAFSRLPPLALEGPLSPAPDPALIQTTSSGPLPRIPTADCRARSTRVRTTGGMNGRGW